MLKRRARASQKKDVTVWMKGTGNNDSVDVIKALLDKSKIITVFQYLNPK